MENQPDIIHSQLGHIISEGVKLTPMMQQYHDIKKQHPGILLLFRMGDFYELFFEDAQEASKILNITLTHRGKLGGFPIPMAGIPFHAASNYVDRITQQGLKAAICEQVEDPKLSKGLVKRAVTQIASPSMPYDLEKINALDYHFLAGATFSDGVYHLTLIDYTTGHFFGHTLHSFRDLLEKIQLYSPREFVSYFDQWEEFPQFKNYLKHNDIAHTYLSREYFNSKFTKHYIEKIFTNFATDKTLADSPSFLDCIGALGYYITSTQPSEHYQHIRAFKLVLDDKEMKVSYATLSGLEILPSSRDGYKQSLLGFMDKTKSSMGTRKLRRYFLSPTRDAQLISARHDYIESLIKDVGLLESQREQLNEVRDVERIMAKVVTARSTISDLINLANTLEIGVNLNKETPKKSLLFSNLKSDEIKVLQKLIQEIRETLNDELGAALEKGSLVKPGFSKSRDRLAKLSQNSNESLLELEQKYRKETSIPNLRIKSNNVAGFFVEVSKSHTSKVPEGFKRRQTLVNCERYTTEELNELEKEVFSAKEKLLKLEREIFQVLLGKIRESASAINFTAELISMVDVFQSLAWVAIQENFSKPKMLKKSSHLKIIEGFHPLIKKELGEHFVSHSLELNSKCSFGLITGPNMAGKTTVMREMAIIQFLAQIGSFVPATSAELGLCDYLFSRLGASDDIIKGQSTFMVEMSETAEILRHASKQSLIILDEIGRGTSTYDGLSIAWALLEYITRKLKCLTLFSTHYHELIEVADTTPNAKNLTVKTHKQGERVVFLYELIEQGATQSFGINVAALAGLPDSILRRSKEILQGLEEKKIQSEIQTEFHYDINTSQNELDVRLSNTDIDQLTPLQALTLLSEWKKELTS